MTPDAAAAVLHALGVRLTVVGGAEHVLRVDVEGGTVSAGYDPQAAPDRRLWFAFRTVAFGRVRVVRRADYPGQPFKHTTGDPAFDARCGVVVDEPGALARLRAPVRGLLADWVGAGGWVSGDGLGMGTEALARLSPAAALAAAESLAHLGRLLYGAAPHAVVQAAQQDPAEGIRAALPDFVGLAMARDRLDVGALLELAEGGGLPGLWHHLTTTVEVDGAATQEALVQAVAQLAPLEALEADGWLLGVLDRFAEEARAHARRALVDRGLRRLAAGDERGAEALFQRARRSSRLLDQLASEAARREITQAARWFRQIPAGRSETLAQIASVLGSLGGAEDLPWLVSLLDNRSPQVTLAAERAFLDLVPDGLAAGGAAAEAIGAVLERGGSTGHTLLDRVQRLGAKAPRGTARLLATRWRGGATLPYVRALAATEDPDATAGLLALLETGYAVTAVEALGRFGTVNALEPLRALTGFFTDGQLREAAKAAVRAIEGRHAARGGLSISVAAPGGGLSPSEEDR